MYDCKSGSYNLIKPDTSRKEAELRDRFKIGRPLFGIFMVWTAETS